MAEENKEDTQQVHHHDHGEANQKCDKCPLTESSGTACWQGTPNCIIHADNINANPAIAQNVADYVDSMAEQAALDVTKCEIF